MKQTITFHDKRKHSKKDRDGQNINLKIERKAETITVTLERETGGMEACTFPLEKGAGETVTCTFPLGKEAGKTEACTFPPESSEAHREKTSMTSWFDHVETVASDAPLEYSGEHFSVCDLLKDLAADDNAFRILTDAIYSMSSLKMTKSLAAMMEDRTLLELVSALDTPADNDSTPHPAGDSGVNRKTPENALQILNAELNKISKK